MAKKEVITQETSDVISEAIAVKEVNSWLDFRKVSDKKRLALIVSINNLVNYVMDGSLTLNEDFSFVQKLKFPLGEVKELVYSPRLSIAEVQPRLVNVRQNDKLGETCAYVAALTNQPTALIGKLNTEDFPLADHLSFFFMA